MTQLSQNTIVYDQVLANVLRFISDKDSVMSRTSNDKAERFSNIVSLLAKSLGRPMLDYDPVIKGEPPSSQKINNYFSTLASDINLISKQIEYSSGQVINIFNLFTQEIEREKILTDRILSKCKILQMYSKAQADDIYYLGDSFDNLDNIDIEKIKLLTNPLISSGSMSLPVGKTKQIKPTAISLNGSNGYIGNNHEAIRDINNSDDESYVYIFSKNSNSNNPNNIIDNSPASYFEYELVNVTSDISNIPVQEFSYWIDKKNIEGKTERDTVYWHSNNLSNGLTLNVTMDFAPSQMCNSIKIVPFFGQSKSVSVESINVFSKDGSSENVLKQPITIGVSNSSFDLIFTKNTFTNEAVVNFSERYVSKIVVRFAQNNKYATKILHTFWKSDYSTRPNDNNPFYEQDRFNPYGLNNQIYSEITFDKYSVIPKLTSPNQFKANARIIKNVPVTILKRNQTINTRAIAFTAKDLSAQPGPDLKFYLKEIYYQNNDQNVISQIDYVAITDPNKEFADETVAPMYFESQAAAQEMINKVASFIATNNIIVGGKTYDIKDPVIESISYQTNERSKTYNVPIKTDRQLLDAERLCIGIRDISVLHQEYQNECEIISKPFNLPYNLESLMLSVDSDISIEKNNSFILKSYISVDDGLNWIQISPIENEFLAIPEVLIFNANTQESNRLSGVSYFNAPQVPSEIKTVIVKLQIARDKSQNITPQIYSYQLIAKVRKS